MKKRFYLLGFIGVLLGTLLLGYVLGMRSYQHCLDELNSYAASNAEFAQYEFFRNLKDHRIYLYSMNPVPDSISIGKYAVIHVPIADVNFNRVGVQNQIAHRTGIVAQFAADQMLRKDRQVGYELLKHLCTLYPDYHLGNRDDEAVKLRNYIRQVEAFMTTGQGDLALLKEIASNYEWHQRKYTVPQEATLPDREELAKTKAISMTPQYASNATQSRYGSLPTTNAVEPRQIQGSKPPAPIVSQPFPAEWFWGTPEQRAVQEALIGKPIPLFDLMDWMNGEIKRADLEEKIVMFDFWATWCSPCKAAMSHNMALYKTYKEKGVIVIGVCSANGQENMNQVLSAERVTYPCAKDCTLKMKEAWKVTWWPTYAFADRQGRVRAVGVKAEKVEAVLQSLLAETAQQKVNR